jgi:predicted Fe-Mo cluster-binding NifX family protein
VNALGGAGIQATQLVLEKGSQAVITGRCGPNSFRVLQASGVSIFEGVQGTVREMIDAWKEGQLVQVTQSGGGHGNKRRDTVPSRQIRMKEEAGKTGTALKENPPPEASSHRKKIKLIREEIKNMEERLVELNRKLDQLNKKNS